MIQALIMGKVKANISKKGFDEFSKSSITTNRSAELLKDYEEAKKRARQMWTEIKKGWAKRNLGAKDF